MKFWKPTKEQTWNTKEYEPLFKCTGDYVAKKGKKAHYSYVTAMLL